MTEGNSIVYDLILLEADRVLSRKKSDRNLYHINKDGEYVQIAEGYSNETDDVLKQLLKKRKMRYMVSFVESLDLMDTLKPSSNKVLRFIARNMGYGNQMKNYSLRDIQQCTDMNMRYVLKAITELTLNDVIRYVSVKNRRTYMVNPIYFYKGTIKKIFYSVREYDKMPKMNNNLTDKDLIKFKNEIN